MKKAIFRVTTLVLALTMLVSIFAVSVSAATAWPSFSSGKPIKVYTISTGNNTTAYTSSSLSSKKGTIYASDECYLYSISKNGNGTWYAYVSYPISNGRKEAYVPLSVFTGATAPQDVITAQTGATTYRRASTSSTAGSISKGDKVYRLTTSGNFVQVVYNIGSASNPSGWRMAWVTSSVYNNLKGSSSTTVSSSTWRYPLDNAYCSWSTKTDMSWSGYNYSSSRSSRTDHVGIDIKSNSGNSNVYAAASGTVAAVGWNNANGNYVIIKHSVSGKTVYSFYCHLSSYCVSNGKSISNGTKIGVMGNTGSSSAGTHLHFAVMDTLWSNGSYYGYVPGFSGNKVSYGGVTYYNPCYLVNYNKLP